MDLASPLLLPNLFDNGFPKPKKMGGPMPRLKRLEVAAINITTEQPHTRERYQQLFNMLRDTTPLVKGACGRHERIMIGFFGEDALSINGSFIRFTRIDPKSPWVDINNRKALIDEDGRPVPQVRDGVGPNMRWINFHFILDDHLLIFDTREISPKQLARGLAQMVAREEFTKEFGQINITVEPRQDALALLLALPKKRAIKILLSLPNGPDAVETLGGQIKARLERQGVARLEEKYCGRSEGEIVPDAELKATMGLAASNGYAEVEYIGERGRLESKSTREYPLREMKMCHDNEYWSTMRWLGGIISTFIRGRNGQKSKPN